MPPNPHFTTQKADGSLTPVVGNEDSLWVFCSLWRACCQAQDVRERSQQPAFSIGVSLNIPVTVLFDEEGSPEYWLITTDEGRLRGLGINSVLPNHALHDPSEKIGEGVRYAVDAMRQFWYSVHRGSSSTVGNPVCIVSASSIFLGFTRPRIISNII